MSAIGTVRSAVKTARERQVTFMAAGVAFYAFMSLLPLLLLVLAVGTLVGGEELATAIVAQFQDVLTDTGQELVVQALRDDAGRTTAGVVGVLTLTWGALKLFRSLTLAFADLYGSTHSVSMLEQVRVGLTAIGAIVLATGLMVAVGAVVDVAAPDATLPFGRILGSLTLVAGIALALLPLYYVLPPVSVSAREVVPGALVAAVGWAALQGLFQVYAANAGQYQAYGVLGGVLLFLTWLYFAAVILLVGAVVNATLTAR
ncbi:YihY/virulence factor BrkB family protein [Halobacteriaceae archaeon GCM10025711]